MKTAFATALLASVTFAAKCGEKVTCKSGDGMKCCDASFNFKFGVDNKDMKAYMACQKAYYEWSDYSDIFEKGCANAVNAKVFMSKEDLEAAAKAEAAKAAAKAKSTADKKASTMKQKDAKSVTDKARNEALQQNCDTRNSKEMQQWLSDTKVMEVCAGGCGLSWPEPKSPPTFKQEICVGRCISCKNENPFKKGEVKRGREGRGSIDCKDVRREIDQGCKDVCEADTTVLGEFMENAKEAASDACNMCKDAAKESEGICQEVNKTIKDVQDYCSDNKNNNNMKESINFMAQQVDLKCVGRSGASTLFMTATAAVISAVLI